MPTPRCPKCQGRSLVKDPAGEIACLHCSFVVREGRFLTTFPDGRQAYEHQVYTLGKTIAAKPYS